MGGLGGKKKKGPTFLGKLKVFVRAEKGEYCSRKRKNRFLRGGGGKSDFIGPPGGKTRRVIKEKGKDITVVGNQ